MIVHTPTTEAQACAVVLSAATSKRTLTLRGGGTRAGLGRPVQAASTLSSAGLSGITLYEPAEMVISARAGTPLELVQETLAERGQMLPFEPMDHRFLYGLQGEPTIGAVAACNISGPRRINAGAARDSLIGVRLVNGRGEMIKSGGRVMKNVTGLDLVKLVSGSHGTLGFLTEVTFRVLPRPERIVTLQWSGLSDSDGIALLSRALGSPFEPMAAAHLPAGLAGDEARTLLRLENFSNSVEYRTGELALSLGEYGEPERLEGTAQTEMWRDVRDATYFAFSAEAIWRLSVRPSDGPVVVKALSTTLPDCRYYFDWGGGLVWLAVPLANDGGAALIRNALSQSGGHATLVRAHDAIRANVGVFQPLPEQLSRLTSGIKMSFDPEGIFEPSRMYAGF